MPIIYVNPAGHRKGASKRRKKHKRSSSMARRRKSSQKRGRGGRFISKKAKARRSRKSKSRRRSRRVKMLAKGLYRVNPSKKRRGGSKKRKSSGKRKRKSSKRRALRTKAIRKFAAAKGYKLVRRAKKGKTKRQRKPGTKTRVAAYRASGGMSLGPSYAPMMNPSRRRRRRNPARRRHARRNPARRSTRRYRRNPSIAGIMTLAKKALPVVAGMVVGKLAVAQISKRVPQLDKLGKFQGPLLSVGMMFAVNMVANKVKQISPYRDQILLGLGINLVTEVLAMTPLKGMLGLGEGIYDRALSDYVTTSDYLTTGAAPIDDDIALADYVTTGALEEELGISEELGLSEELGISEELGAIEAGTVRGGVSSTALTKAVPRQAFTAEIPARSFSKEVGHAGEGFDNPAALYAGIFRGGF